MAKMTMRCSCGSSLKMNIDTFRFDCIDCSNIYFLEKRNLQTFPCTISVNRVTDGLKITVPYSYSQFKVVRLTLLPLFFTIVGIGFLFLNKDSLTSLFLSFLAILIVASMVALSYKILLGLNVSALDIKANVLKVKHGPLPWTRREQFALTTLKQIYVVKSHKDKKHELWFVTKDRKRHKLLRHLSSENGLNLAQAIEQYLSTDAPLKIDLTPAEVRSTQHTAKELTLQGIVTEHIGDAVKFTYWQRSRRAFGFRGVLAAAGLFFLPFMGLFAVLFFGVVALGMLTSLPFSPGIIIFSVLYVAIPLVIIIPQVIKHKEEWYQSLTQLFNKNAIWIDTQILSVKHGPLPYKCGPKSFTLADIRQLYVKKKPANKEHSYELYLITQDENRHNLLETKELEQALYLEQKIERLLNLDDRPVSGQSSLPYHKKKAFASWKKVADRHDLDFSDWVNGVGVLGVYRGYNLELRPIFRRKEKADTQLALSSVDAPVYASKTGQSLVEQDVEALLTPTNADFELGGWLQITQQGQRLVYEQKDIETDPDYLRFLFDKCCDLLDVYPQIVALGGEAIPALLQITDQKTHPLQQMAICLLSDIGQDTTHRLGRKASSIVCPTCMVYFAAHKIPRQPLNTTYYGCRACRQSRDFKQWPGRIVAILDNTQTEHYSEVNGTLHVNWLQHRQPFDFDTIEILNATDEEVERFAVQVGNDTDPLRQPKYKQIPCYISPERRLSENTIRILRRTFGRVEIQ